MVIELYENPDGLTPQKTPKSCKICRHFCPYVYEIDVEEPNNQLLSDYGECRRFPPKAASPEDTVFPVVQEDMWCGEFDI